MLWISSISGSPESSIPRSFSSGMRRSPNASNCSRESQISLTRKFPFDLKATWYSSPSGSQSPDFSRRRMVSSYCSVVTLGAAVKRARMLVLRASMTGVADGTVVAIRGLLVWMPLTKPTYNRTRLTTLAWRARILSQKALPNVAGLHPSLPNRACFFEGGDRREIAPASVAIHPVWTNGRTAQDYGGIAALFDLLPGLPSGSTAASHESGL